MAKQSQKMPKNESENYGQFSIGSKENLKKFRATLEEIGIEISREYVIISRGHGYAMSIRRYGVNVAFPETVRKTMMAHGYGWYLRTMRIIPRNTIPENSI